MKGPIGRPAAQKFPKLNQTPIENSNPSFVAEAAKRGKHDGAVKSTLEHPIKVKDAAVGMKVVQSGELCTIKRIEPVKQRELKGLYILEFSKHPRRDSFSTVLKAEDLLYQRIGEKYSE